MTLETTKPSTFSTELFDTRDLRNALGTFATGVTIVTTMMPTGEPIGFTANSFTSVSLDPPLILVCIAKSAAGYAAYTSADAFCVNILSEDQRDLSGTFAQRGTDKFIGVGWRQGQTGSPILDGGVGHFDCDMHQLVDAGDHAILIGRVVGYDANDDAPLCYHRGKYAGLEPVAPKPVNYLAARTSDVPHLKQNLIQPMGEQS